MTIIEIKRSLESKRSDGFTISMSTINACLKELKITVKLAHRELDRVNSTDKIILRKDYSLWFNNYFNSDYSRAVFIDESSFNLHLKRSHARSKKGTRAIITVPTVRGRSVSLLASMTVNGIRYCKVISKTTVNAVIFSEFIREVCIHLRDELRMENACLILDNARIHRREDILRITSEFNCEFHYLSPYSYMLNPIENSFSKIKNGMRSRLRTGESGSLPDLILEEARKVTAEDCSAYFRHICRNITNCAAELPYLHK